MGKRKQRDGAGLSDVPLTSGATNKKTPAKRSRQRYEVVPDGLREQDVEQFLLSAFHTLTRPNVSAHKVHESMSTIDYLFRQAPNNDAQQQLMQWMSEVGSPPESTLVHAICQWWMRDDQPRIQQHACWILYHCSLASTEKLLYWIEQHRLFDCWLQMIQRYSSQWMFAEPLLTMFGNWCWDESPRIRQLIAEQVNAKHGAVIMQLLVQLTETVGAFANAKHDDDEKRQLVQWAVTPLLHALASNGADDNAPFPAALRTWATSQAQAIVGTFTTHDAFNIKDQRGVENQMSYMHAVSRLAGPVLTSTSDYLAWIEDALSRILFTHGGLPVTTPEEEAFFAHYYGWLSTELPRMIANRWSADIERDMVDSLLYKPFMKKGDDALPLSVRTIIATTLTQYCFSLGAYATIDTQRLQPRLALVPTLERQLYETLIIEQSAADHAGFYWPLKFVLLAARINTTPLAPTQSARAVATLEWCMMGVWREFDFSAWYEGQQECTVLILEYCLSVCQMVTGWRADEQLTRALCKEWQPLWSQLQMHPHPRIGELAEACCDQLM